jgi:hypothetical protein
VSITANSDFTITGTGMVSNSACVSTLTFGQGVENSYLIGSAFQLAATNTSTGTIVVIDAIPSVSGGYTLHYNLQTNTCGDAGNGTATKQ